jgi:ORF6N domain-containing protein
MHAHCAQQSTVERAWRRRHHQQALPEQPDSARPIYSRGEMESDENPPATIDTQIHVIRGVSVMLDSDLASLYGVPVKALLQAVRRNRKRFPRDFLFPVLGQDLTRLRSQIVTSNDAEGRGGRRYQIYAFTEQGVAMLSSVLRSETFVRLRRAALVSTQVMALVEDLSKRVEVHDAVITDIVESIRQMVEAPKRGRSRPIGFTADLEPKN